MDETGVDKYYQREYGRALKGEKIMDTKRGRRFKRTNLIGGLCCGNYYGIETYDQTTTSDFFINWFEKNLLIEVPIGYTIVMDNASFHPKEKLKIIANKFGVNLIFLPPYSPDLNPIETSWANFKRWLRDNLSLFSNFFLAASFYFYR